MPDAASWVKLSQAIAATPKVVALIPSIRHGDTAEKPSPVPRIISSSDKAAAPAAPAKMAAHDTALFVQGASTVFIGTRRSITGSKTRLTFDIVFSIAVIDQ